jgi:two-component system nitrate/nitrite response regulator NarL
VSRRTRVLLVDDHTLFRQGLASLLGSQRDFEVVGEAEDGLEALVKARELEPDLVLMDVTMPGGDGLEGTRLIKQALPQAKIVMLTVHDEDEKLFEAVKRGAVGYVLKSTAAETLIPLLRGAVRGEAAISQGLAIRILQEFSQLASREKTPNPQDLPPLTSREKEVLELVATGAMDKEIAAALTISLSTVKTHVRNILAKLQSSSRHQAAELAVRKGLIHPPFAGTE